MKNIEETLKKYPDILFAYLFGSAARSRLNKESDIDIAVFLDITGGFDINKTLNLRLDLMSELERQCGRKVEVIVLNNAPVLLKHEVVSAGKLLYSTNEDARLGFESLVRRIYFDFKTLLSAHTANFLNRLKEKKLDECTRSNRFKT